MDALINFLKIRPKGKGSAANCLWFAMWIFIISNLMAPVFTLVALFLTLLAKIAGIDAMPLLNFLSRY